MQENNSFVNGLFFNVLSVFFVVLTTGLWDHHCLITTGQVSLMYLMLVHLKVTHTTEVQNRTVTALKSASSQTFNNWRHGESTGLDTELVIEG